MASGSSRNCHSRKSNKIVTEQCKNDSLFSLFQRRCRRCRRCRRWRRCRWCRRQTTMATLTYFLMPSVTSPLSMLMLSKLSLHRPTLLVVTVDDVEVVGPRSSILMGSSLKPSSKFGRIWKCSWTFFWATIWVTIWTSIWTSIWVRIWTSIWFTI